MALKNVNLGNKRSYKNHNSTNKIQREELTKQIANDETIHETELENHKIENIHYLNNSILYLKKKILQE